VICCGTFSKGYAMTGWRLGWVVASPRTAEQIRLVHQTLNGPLNTFVQDAAVAALSLPIDHQREMTRVYQERRDLVFATLSEVACVSLALPQGAFYAFPRVDLPMASIDICARLAEAGVVVRAGSEFGPSGEGHLRISYAADTAAVSEGLRRMTAALVGLEHELRPTQRKAHA
jgi:aspartate aminotransferase